MKDDKKKTKTPDKAKKVLDDKAHLLEFAKNIKKGKAQDAMKNLKMAVAIKQQKRLDSIGESKKS